MNENLDLTKILEGCPKGTKFYSAIHGEISFKRLELPSLYPMQFDSDAVGKTIYLTEKGRVLLDAGECVLFPSKDQRDWSKFERFWDKPKKERFDPKTLQPFDKVLVRDNPLNKWRPDFFGFLVQYEKYIICAGSFWYQCIPYNEETKHLVGTKEDCPKFYKWWEK